MSSSESTSATGSPYALSRASSQTSFETYQDEVDARLASSIRSIVFVGAGYVGGPTAAVIAYRCPHVRVTVVDKFEERIAKWQSRHLPIHEPGLKDIVRYARDGTKEPVPRWPNLFFSTDCEKNIAEADAIFLAVNTPTKTNGIGAGAATDMSMFESAARSVALVAKPGAIIIEKSTVPCRTAEMVKEILGFYRPGEDFEVLSNPEFLAEGTAVRDLLSPSRVLIGSSPSPTGVAAAARLAEVYSNWVPKSSVLTIDVWSSELAKLVANAMLAQRISSINTVSAICEKTGADVDNVAKAIGSDPRLGSKFLKSGLGFGGSCFKKDILSLSYLAESLELPEVATYWRSVIEINEWQCRRFVKGVLQSLNGSLRGKKVALFGYAFKKDTGDTRESQATEVVRILMQECPAEIAIYDPQCDKTHVEEELASLSSTSTETRSSGAVLKPTGPVSVCDNPYDACTTATAILILTEWDQFRYPPRASESPQCKQTVSQRKPLHDIAVERHDSACEGIPTMQSVKASSQTAATDNELQRLAAEPDCPADCRDCYVDSQSATLQSKDAIDWPTVGKLMRGERWVFDGRGVVEQAEMEKLGFRVSGIGRASTRSKLR